MPYLKIKTNIALEKTKSEPVLQELTQLIADETGKSESYIMIELAEGLTMSFAGTSNPLAFIECKSIGLTTLQAKSLAQVLCRYMEQQFNIPADRCYIEFSNSPAEYFGWNSRTFA